MVRFRYLLTLALAAGISLAACAASKVRLVYGKDWSRAGRSVKTTLTSSAFKTAAKGRYVVELVEETGNKAAEGNLGSWKLPCIFLISEAGNCFCVMDNVPHDASAERLVSLFNRADAIRVAAEKSGFATADECGEFLQKMERYVGGPRRVVSKGFYEDVFEKLKKLDPSDSTGWQRHFTLGLELDKNTKADGLELVIKANEFREKGQMTDGQSFIDGEKKKPRQHLSKEQLQGILMAQFALYREDASKAEELDRILLKVAEYDETTLWGTAALGWLNIRKKPPLSVYWGWHKGDFTGARFTQTVKYGVGHAFPKTGRYTIRFANESGAPVKFESVTLMAGKEAVKTLKNPAFDLGAYTFEFDLTREYRGKITSMVVKGDAPATGDSSGKIAIARTVLRPRKEVK